MIADIKTILEGEGYTVLLQDQEATRPGELVIILLDIELRVETQTSYYINEYIDIYWSTDDVDSIMDDVVKISTVVTGSVNRPMFKFRKPKITKLGTAYKIDLVCENPGVYDL